MLFVDVGFAELLFLETLQFYNPLCCFRECRLSKKRWDTEMSTMPTNT